MSGRPEETGHGARGRSPDGIAPFAFLWTAQFLSQLGDSVFQIAFVWLVLELTGSKAMTGAAATLSYLPHLLFGLVAGLLVDRWNRRLVMAWADVARAALLATAGVLLWRGALTAPVLTAIAFAAATAAVFFVPGRDSLLPEIVPAGSLSKANAWVQMSQMAAFLFGPLAAGLLIQHGGVLAALPAGVALFVGSLASLFAMRGVGAGHRSGGEISGWLEDFRSGLKAIGRHKDLVLLLLATALDNLFIMGPAVVGNVVIVRETLGRGPSDYALLEAVYGTGMVLGTLAVGQAGHRVPAGRLLVAGMVMDGLTYIPLLYCRSFSYLLAFSFFHSLFIPAITVPRATILQRIVPARLVGRAFALQNAVVIGMTALSSGLAGLALERIPAPTLFAVAGSLGAGVGLFCFASPLARRL